MWGSVELVWSKFSHNTINCAANHCAANHKPKKKKEITQKNEVFPHI